MLIEKENEENKTFCIQHIFLKLDRLKLYYGNLRTLIAINIVNPFEGYRVSKNKQT